MAEEISANYLLTKYNIDSPAKNYYMHTIQQQFSISNINLNC